MFGQFLMTAISPASVIPSHLLRFKYFKLFEAMDWMPSLVTSLSLRSLSSSTSQRTLDRLIIPLSFGGVGGVGGWGVGQEYRKHADVQKGTEMRASYEWTGAFYEIRSTGVW